MKKILLAAFLFPFLCFGQEMALDKDSDKVTFSEVVPVEEVGDDELYSRARQWFAESYKSANDVLQLDDATSGKLIGKALSRIQTKTPINTNNNIKMWYTIKVFVKDGRYKYIITDIEYQGDPSKYDLSPGKIPCENFLIGEGYYKKNGKPREMSVSYSVATVSVVNSLVSSLKKAMASTHQVSTKDEDW